MILSAKGVLCHMRAAGYAPERPETFGGGEKPLLLPPSFLTGICIPQMDLKFVGIFDIIHIFE